MSISSSGGAAAMITIGPDEAEDGDRSESPGPVSKVRPDRAARAGKPLILLVEDDYLVGMEVEAALVEAGFEVAGIAASAEEAVMLAERGRPALVVMDIRLVGKRDGVDAALEIHRRFGIRAVFASAHGDSEIRARAAAARPAGWIDKPYRLSTLLAAVRKALAEIEGEERPEPPPEPRPQP